MYELAAPRSLQKVGLWTPAGLREASVFPGFCGKHDGALFADIDNPTGSITARHAALLCYRAVTKELWSRQRSLAFTLESKCFLDRGQRIEDQLQIQNHLNLQAHHSLLAVNDLTTAKSRLEDALFTSEIAFGAFGWRCFDLGTLLPVVGCGGYCCAADFLGQPCTWHSGDSRTSGEIAMLHHAVVPWRGTTHVVFGWLNDAYEATYLQLVESFERLTPDNRREAIIRFLFEVSENIFVRKSWWDRLSAAVKTSIQERMLTGGAGQGHSSSCLLPDGVQFLPAT